MGHTVVLVLVDPHDRVGPDIDEAWLVFVEGQLELCQEGGPVLAEYLLVDLLHKEAELADVVGYRRLLLLRRFT